MQQIIYTSKFYCELCQKDVPISLYGSSDSTFSSNDESELIEWARHFHWIDNHRVCAICGKLVRSKLGELKVAVNDGKIVIHEDYTRDYKKVETGDRFGHLLIVHANCISKKVGI